MDIVVGYASATTDRISPPTHEHRSQPAEAKTALAIETNHAAAEAGARPKCSGGGIHACRTTRPVGRYEGRLWCV